MTEGLFVLCPQLGQDLLVAGLPTGDPVKVAAGGFADRHALGGKGSADVAEIAFVLRSRNIFHGNKFSHIIYSLPLVCRGIFQPLHLALRTGIHLHKTTFGTQYSMYRFYLTRFSLPLRFS